MKAHEIQRAADAIQTICWMFLTLGALLVLWLMIVAAGLLIYPPVLPYILPGYNAASDARWLQAFLDSEWRVVFGMAAIIASGLGLAVTAAFYDYQKRVRNAVVSTKQKVET